MEHALTEQPPQAKPELRVRFELLRSHGGTLMLALVLVLNVALTPHFLEGGTLRNFLLQVYPTLLIAVGMTLVIATSGIDISVGAVMALSASVAGRLQSGGAGLALALLGGVAAAALCGLFNGVLVARLRIQPIIVTFILMIGGRGLAQIILGELALSTYGTSLATLGSFTLFGFLPVQVVTKQWATIPRRRASSAFGSRPTSPWCTWCRRCSAAPPGSWRAPASTPSMPARSAR